MRLTAAAVFAGAASSAAAAAVSYSSSGKPHETSSNISPLSLAPGSLNSTPEVPVVTITHSYTATTILTITPKGSVSDSSPSTKPPITTDTETDLAQPSNLPTSGGYKTIGCGCSYRFPNGYLECPFSGSEAPSGYCSTEVVTTTKQPDLDNAAQATTAASHDASTTPESSNPTSALSSIISAASSWPSGVHPGMMPPNTPAANETCVTSLNGMFILGKVGMAAPSHDVDKMVIHTTIARLSLIDGNLIDSSNRIGDIASNGQFQFDGPPQVGVLYTAGFYACGSQGHRKLALGGSTTFYACNSDTFSNWYYKATGGLCSAVELAIVMHDQEQPDQHENGDELALTTQTSRTKRTKILLWTLLLCSMPMHLLGATPTQHFFHSTSKLSASASAVRTRRPVQTPAEMRCQKRC